MPELALERTVGRSPWRKVALVLERIGSLRRGAVVHPVELVGRNDDALLRRHAVLFMRLAQTRLTGVIGHAPCWCKNPADGDRLDVTLDGLNRTVHAAGRRTLQPKGISEPVPVTSIDWR